MVTVYVKLEIIKYIVALVLQKVKACRLSCLPSICLFYKTKIQQIQAKKSLNYKKLGYLSLLPLLLQDTIMHVMMV